jgi:hypothetical protein
VDQHSPVGVEFARALAAKDSGRLLDLLHPDIDFRGLTPGGSWEANDPQAVLAVLLGKWFEEADAIEAVDRLESDAFADRERVGYRFLITNPEGDFVVEQQAYLSELDGQIGWMRVLCSGYRPASSAA